MSLPRILLLALLLPGAAVTAFTQGVTLITPTNTTWRYFTNGTDPGTGWALPGFDDSSWPQGVGLFGNDGNVYAPLSFNTSIVGPGQGGPLTAYFRTHFNWNGSPLGVVLVGTNYVDDGCVVYLNGIEITRFNMPAGPPAYDTLALLANPGGFPNIVNAGEPVLVQMQIPLGSLTNGNINPLVSGDNILAVEVHQNSRTSSDVVFGMSLFAGQCHPHCFTDGIQPTNRTVVEGRSTTFIVVSTPCIPTPSFQWYRDVGVGEELIPNARRASFTLTNALDGIDDGVYYCRITSVCGALDSRRAVLVVQHDDVFPQFISASVIGPGLNKFRLTTDEELCGNDIGCGSDFKLVWNWQVLQADNPSVDLGVVSVTQINPNTYEFITSIPRDPTKQYQIAISPFGELGDLFGNPVLSGTFAQTYLTAIFAQGLAGYTGTQDAGIHSNAYADTPQGALTHMRMDLDDGGVAQGLLRFESIIGSGANQIPFGMRIISAILTLNQIDLGTQVNLHRMLAPWDQATVTWNSMGDGITTNDTEAFSAIDATIPTYIANGAVELNVTAAIQAWANGQLNFGWAFLSTGGDGLIVSTSESEATNVPMLTVAYDHGGDVCEPAILVQPPAFIRPWELQTVSISVGVASTFMPVFQWTKNGVDIPGANQLIYTIQSVSFSDSGTYRLRISCESDPSRTITSNPTVLVIGAPPPRPYLTGAAAESDGETITLRFSEPMNQASAETIANYVFHPPLPVLGAAYSNSSVTLTTAQREVGSNYTLRIAGLRSTQLAENLIFPNPIIIALTSARVIVPWNADGWYYYTNNLDATPDWKNRAFTPGPGWRFGPGLFGLETSPSILAAAPAPIVTQLTPNSTAPGDQLTTTYFRKVIDLPPLPAGARYVVCHYTDDGFIAYLDGAEIHRFAMPTGAVTFTNRSTGIPNGEASYRSFSFNATPGPHTLAVELHQAGTTSSNVLFGMEVRLVDDASPALSIAPSINGGVSLNWNADDNWRLRRAAALTGPYLDVAIPASTRFGTYRLPSSSATNGTAFFRLDYIGRP